MSAPILNVGDLCTRLTEELAGREQELLNGQPQVKETDGLTSVEATAVLEQNLVRLDGALNHGTAAEMLGSQEAIAFLTGVANAHHRRYLPRTAQWQRSHERTLRAGRVTEVIGRQLRGIGEKVDPVVVSTMLGGKQGAA